MRYFVENGSSSSFTSSPSLLDMPPPGCNSPAPPHWALSFADLLADYMVDLFQYQISQGPEEIRHLRPIPQIGLETLCEASLMVSKIVLAYRNQVQLAEVDIVRLAETAHQSNQIEVHTEDLMLPANPGIRRELREPTVIIDRSGHVLLWYLPGAMSQPNQPLQHDVTITHSFEFFAQQVTENSDLVRQRADYTVIIVIT
ncbi:hypothetical protein L210DRAFT_3641096 [Boletus edulis BED1]|uniref:Uncharacterized protein n=1 Tax=Boletus edulis BED1 TaxID=1328754 RepID=A0AAD4C6L2_BOLED|nr:hypothetical protein L210DRAFT_3641096 [Boletus edulis BED1]